jgi:hypothetical protein
MHKGLELLQMAASDFFSFFSMKKIFFYLLLFLSIELSAQQINIEPAFWWIGSCDAKKSRNG